MSVINKMLRDLDQRQAVPGHTDAQRAGSADTAVQRGTASVNAAPGRARPVGPFASRAVVVACMLLALVAGGAYWWWHKPSPEMAAAPAAAQTVALPVAATASASEPAKTTAATPATGTAAATVAPPAMASPPAAAPQAGSTLAKLPTTKVARIEASGNAQVSGKARPAAPLSPLAPQATSSVLTPIALPAPQVATSSTASGAVAGAAPGASPSAVTSTDAQAAQARQMQAGREALAQAQGLWNAGSHDAANELLQHALVLAERSASASPTPANSQLLATLAREQARMHIADGRAQAALDGLARLEPLLGQEADVWALRGNAAQRLGRHPESLRAYTTALQMRPNEQRWLLGAAVSMAALGQTANASEMAAKARAIGPVSKEVQSYLRQAGVTLIEP